MLLRFGSLTAPRCGRVATVSKWRGDRVEMNQQDSLVSAAFGSLLRLAHIRCSWRIPIQVITRVSNWETSLGHTCPDRRHPSAWKQSAALLAPWCEWSVNVDDGRPGALADLSDVADGHWISGRPGTSSGWSRWVQSPCASGAAPRPSGGCYLGQEAGQRRPAPRLPWSQSAAGAEAVVGRVAVDLGVGEGDGTRGV